MAPGQASWEIQPLGDDSGWHQLGHTVRRVHNHPQELAENSIDTTHLSGLHDLRNVQNGLGQRNRGSGCSKDGLRSRGELLCAGYAKGQIKVSVVEPNRIEWRLIQNPAPDVHA
ncbi:hypothetical protein [Mycobacterium rhizamassiliense]|jgi:hypothetical protein|uniref:hypothetical protein n=1 Tax=Mycobacterium rhizamassiliense TaxID=1841860 RepID=UPI0012FFADCB|nr:hypothetical protein [Mycobacterium rhizamassiliense]